MQPGAGLEKVTPISPCRDVACYVLSAAFKTKTQQAKSLRQMGICTLASVPCRFF